MYDVNIINDGSKLIKESKDISLIGLGPQTIDGDKRPLLFEVKLKSNDISFLILLDNPHGNINTIHTNVKVKLNTNCDHKYNDIDRFLEDLRCIGIISLNKKILLNRALNSVYELGVIKKEGDKEIVTNKVKRHHGNHSSVEIDDRYYDSKTNSLDYTKLFYYIAKELKLIEYSEFEKMVHPEYDKLSGHL